MLACDMKVLTCDMEGENSGGREERDAQEEEGREGEKGLEDGMEGGDMSWTPGTEGGEGGNDCSLSTYCLPRWL